MDEDNNEEYFRTLITQPPQSQYNQYEYVDTVPITVLERVFCADDDVEASTESEHSECVVLESNGREKQNMITPERSLVPVSIHCDTVKTKKEKGDSFNYCFTIITAYFNCLI